RSVVTRRPVGPGRSRSSRGDARLVRRIGAETVAVEGAVDVFEGGDDLFAARRVTVLSQFAVSVVVFQPDELGEELFTAGNQALALGSLRLGIVRPAGHPDSTNDDGRYQAQGNPTRYRTVMWKVFECQHDWLAGPYPPSGTGNEGLTRGSHVLLRGKL